MKPAVSPEIEARPSMANPAATSITPKAAVRRGGATRCTIRKRLGPERSKLEEPGTTMSSRDRPRTPPDRVIRSAHGVARERTTDQGGRRCPLTWDLVRTPAGL